MDPITTIDTASQTIGAQLLLKIKPTVEWIDAWRFQPNVTPFSWWPWPIGASVFYAFAVIGLQKLMRKRDPMQIPYVLFFHNITLCFASLLLATWLTYMLASHLYNGMTPFGLLCSKKIYFNGHMHMIYYINMFFKVWEFMDTFFLCVRKKPVAFLHSYHHAATLILTWNQLMEHSAPQWVPIVINLWVHVAMYYYYAMSALKIKIWWKKYLTTLQICQFIIDVSLISYAFATFIKAGFDPDVCYGTVKGALVGLGVLFSYLLLFIRFYVQTYSRKSAEKPLKKE